MKKKTALKDLTAGFWIGAVLGLIAKGFLLGCGLLLAFRLFG